MSQVAGAAMAEGPEVEPGAGRPHGQGKTTGDWPHQVSKSACQPWTWVLLLPCCAPGFHYCLFVRLFSAFFF